MWGSAPSNQSVSAAGADIDLAHDAVRFRTDQIDRQQAVGEVGPEDLHAVGEEEGPLELARRNAAVKKVPLALVDLATAHTTSWLSSSMTSNWSRVKPATASVMRRRSGSLSVRGSRSML